MADLDSIAIVVQAPPLPEATVYANPPFRQLRAESAPLKQISYSIAPRPLWDRVLRYLANERVISGPSHASHHPMPC